MTIKPDQVRHNGMTENLGTDVVAVDAQGNVLGRASTRESAERASPDAVAFFTGADFEGVSSSQIAKAAAQPNDALARVVAQVDPAVLADYASPDVVVQFDGDPEDPPFVAPDAEPTPSVKINSTTESPAEAHAGLAQVKEEGGAILPDGTTLTKAENDERKARLPTAAPSTTMATASPEARKANRQRKPA